MSDPGDYYTETRRCEYCQDGWAESAPRPTPQGPHSTYAPCTACGGSGMVMVDLYPIEQEDLPDDPW